MGILFIADNILTPSQLWMRRMLDGLGRDVSLLATDVDPGPDYRRRYRWLSTAPTYIERVLWRAHQMIPRIPTHPRLRLAVQAANVSAVLVHYLTKAVDLDGIWRATRKPVWVHCHGWDVTWNLRTCEAVPRPVHAANYVERVKNLPQNVRFIANSQRTKRRLLDIGIADNRICVKYLGVEVPSECPVRSHNEGRIQILYLGRLVDCKGPELVIRAFEQACDRRLDAVLTIAGDGPLRMTCELLIAHSPYAERIEFLGAVDRAAGMELREKADIFCAHNCLGPITWQEEAYGVALVEAMAAGLPIITGRNGSVPEIMEDGKQAILVEPGNVKAQAEALIRLANDPPLRQQMGRSGWERARDRFTIESEIVTLREILSLPARATDNI